MFLISRCLYAINGKVDKGKNISLIFLISVDGCRSKLEKRGVRSASGMCFGSAVVPLVHRGTFPSNVKQALRLC